MATTISVVSVEMPQFNSHIKGANGKPAVLLKNGIPMIVEPRCKVCKSPHRHAVDKLLASGFSYSEIERQFAAAQIPRRSIASHAREHLNYEQAAFREVIEKEALNAQRNFDEGVSRLVTKNAYLEVALQKAYDALMNNDTIVEPKDAVKVIEMLTKLQEQNQTVAMDELRVQFQYFMQAVKEVIPKDDWEAIVDRTADLLRASGRSVDWETSTEDTVDAPLQAIEEVVDADVVDS